MYKTFAVMLFVCSFFCGPVVAAEEELASTLVQLLAGNGLWGTIILAVAGVVWYIMRPHLQAWLRDRNLGLLYSAIEMSVVFTDENIVKPLKKKLEENDGGDITKEQYEEIKDGCKQKIYTILEEQGAAWMKSACANIIDTAIEHCLAKHKIAKAVIAPLPDLQP